MEFITLNNSNIDKEHICCAFSDKKCVEGYQLKKDWLKKEFENGYVFRRLDARAKVFIEYAPAEHSWTPVIAPNYLSVGCFWVSGQYKGQGYGKQLLQFAIDDAKAQGKSGLVAVVGTKKFHFMSDTKWMLKQGFKTVDTTSYGFSLLALQLDDSAPMPKFSDQVRSGECDNKEGLTVYYTNRCPYCEFNVREVLAQTAQKYHLPLQIEKIETNEQAQLSPTPATIFSLFYKGKFVTTDISVCLESRFEKIVSI